MADSSFPLDPKRVFFTVDRDREWKTVTAESFICTTTDDLVEEDPYMFLEPEKLSIRDLMKIWLKDNTNHGKCCDMCECSFGDFKKFLLLLEPNQQWQRKKYRQQVSNYVQQSQ